jgi:hypothetical protein
LEISLVRAGIYLCMDKSEKYNLASKQVQSKKERKKERVI